MGKTVTVSAKIDDDLRKKMNTLGVQPSPVIRKALEEAVRKKEWDLAMSRLEKVSPLLRKVGKRGWAAALRETRRAG